jgi:hypothetical protein
MDADADNVASNGDVHIIDGVLASWRLGAQLRFIIQYFD